MLYNIIIYMNKKYDVIVIGAGFAGATAANLLARSGKQVLVIEKRDHIGGNSYDYIHSNGVLVHKYGPHIFHTNYKEVFEYLKEFGEFVPYKHKVLANIDGTLIPVPFNFTSLEILYNEKAKSLEDKILKRYPNQNRVSVLDLINDNDLDIKEFGNFVYEKVFAYYTAKQWGTTIDKIDKSVINRVPVVLGYEDTYFSDTYQFMPKDGFTSLFIKMLDHPNIEVRLNTPANKVIKLLDGKIYLNEELFLGKLIYTGALDELFEYRFGPLPYRSLRLDFIDLDVTYYQSNSVINYTTSEDFTRITEFKYLSQQDIKNKTTILKEYSLGYTKDNYLKVCPYYPIFTKENYALYERYKFLADKYPQISLCGRLAEYKYYNMDVVILKAFELVKSLK